MSWRSWSAVERFGSVAVGIRASGETARRQSGMTSKQRRRRRDVPVLARSRSDVIRRGGRFRERFSGMKRLFDRGVGFQHALGRLEHERQKAYGNEDDSGVV